MCFCGVLGLSGYSLIDPGSILGHHIFHEKSSFSAQNYKSVIAAHSFRSTAGNQTENMICICLSYVRDRLLECWLIGFTSDKSRFSIKNPGRRRHIDFCPKGPHRGKSARECFAPFHHEKCQNVGQKWARARQVEDPPVSTRKAPRTPTTQESASHHFA